MDENDAACYIESFKARYKGAQRNVSLFSGFALDVSGNVGTNMQFYLSI